MTIGLCNTHSRLVNSWLVVQVSRGIELRVLVDEPAEEAAVDRAVGHETDPQFAAQGQHAVLHRAVHQVVFALDGCNGADGVGAANGVGVHLAQPEVLHLAFFDELGNNLRHRLYRCVRVTAVLVEQGDALHAEAAEGVFAHLADVGRAAVFFRLYLHAVHELVPELGGDIHLIYISKS